MVSCIPGQSSPHYVTKDDFELQIFLPPPTILEECTSLCGAGIKLRALGMLRQVLYQLGCIPGNQATHEQPAAWESSFYPLCSSTPLGPVGLTVALRTPEQLEST